MAGLCVGDVDMCDASEMLPRAYRTSRGADALGKAQAAQYEAAAHCAALAAFSADHQRRLDALCDAVSRLQVAVEALRGARCVRCGSATAL